MKPFSFQSKIGRFILNYIQHYNHNKYWKRRAIVIDPNSKVPLFVRLWFLYYIKKTDAFHNCSFGTNLGAGAKYGTPPHLPHGPSGIIVGHDLIIGSNVTIFQQVTLSHGGSLIGDNVMFGAGSKLLSSINVGNNVKIGLNCVVVENVPDDSTVVLHKPRVIARTT